MLIIEKDISSRINTKFKSNKYSKYFILVDENTKKHCLHKLNLTEKFILIEIKSGEKNKNLETCQFIWNNLLENKADRNALLINLGGGVICDMGGFCASTYKRGIKFINIPTTLLSQVDASVGSKTGVNFLNQKNMIGLFSEPKDVLIASIFLNTLESRQILSGFAEILKHGLIIKKKYFRNCIANYLNGTIEWNKVIKKSVEIKSSVVKKDPKEKGLRKILNFGHTVGHALESYSLVNHKKPLLHGEAVVLGMISELFLSFKKNLLSKDEMELSIFSLLSVYSFKGIENFDYKEIEKLVLNDKKNKNNQVKVVLLESIGKAIFDQEITKKELLDSLLFLNQKLTNA